MSLLLMATLLAFGAVGSRVEAAGSVPHPQCACPADCGGCPAMTLTGDASCRAACVALLPHIPLFGIRPQARVSVAIANPRFLRQDTPSPEPPPPRAA